MQHTRHAKTLRMVQLAILIAIMLLFAFTPVGYLRIGPVAITFMVLPVAVGAIALGPAAGALLGGVFGLTSFIRCFLGDVFGTLVLSINPFLTFLMCMVPRILCGWLSGLLFRVLQKIDRTRLASYFAASLSTALLNTLLFVLSIVLLFWHNPAFVDGVAGLGLATDTLWIFIIGFVGINGVIEAVVNFIIGGAAAKVVVRFVNNRQGD